MSICICKTTVCKPGVHSPVVWPHSRRQIQPHTGPSPALLPPGTATQILPFDPVWKLYILGAVWGSAPSSGASCHLSCGIISLITPIIRGGAQSFVKTQFLFWSTMPFLHCWFILYTASRTEKCCLPTLSVVKLNDWEERKEPSLLPTLGIHPLLSRHNCEDEEEECCHIATIHLASVWQFQAFSGSV